MHRPIQLINVTNPFPFIPTDRNTALIPYTAGMTVADLAEPFRRELRTRGYEGDIVAVRRGEVVHDMTAPVCPNDCITLFVQYGSGDVLKTVAGLALMVVAVATGAWVTGLGMFAGSGALLGMGGTFWGALSSAAVMTLGGLVINSVFPAASPSSSSSSPTYGWQGYYNNVKPGYVIPIAIGECAIAAQIINQYLAADNEHNQWAYFLFGVAQGETGTPVTEDDILLGDEPLTSYTSDVDYSFSANSGSLAVAGALPNFESIHHYRKMDKEITYDESTASGEAVALLLHCNGTAGSTTITDEARGGTWACNGTAAITTIDPFLGTGALSLPANGDYIDTDDFEALRFPGYFTFECRITRTSDVDNGIFSQQVQDVTYGTGKFTRVSLVYQSGGALVFQAGEGGGTSWSVRAQAIALVELSLGAWYHVCVQCRKNNIRIYVNGVIEGSCTGAWDYYWPESLVDNEYDPIDYASLNAALKASYQTRVGHGWLIDYGVYPNTVTDVYGNCMLDEVRTARGVVYDFAGFTPPASELSGSYTPPEEGEAVVVATKGACDSVKLMIEFPYGLVRKRSDGDIDIARVGLKVSYRASGGAGSWTEAAHELSAESTSWVRKQIEVAFPSRGEYDVQIQRTTEDREEGSKISDRSFLTGFDQISNYACGYPGIQCVALGIKASDTLSGQVPAIRIINRPSNIDVPDWSVTGTMSVDPTTPGWAAYAALCHPKYGRGISPTRLNRTKWEEWIAWTEGLVGGARRTQFNGVFDGSPASLKTALNHIENVGRAKIIPIGQTYSVMIDKPDVARGLYTYGKIIPDTFKIQWIPKEDKVDEIEIEYFDRERNYDAHSVYARSSAFDNLDRPARSTKLTLIGCNNEDQAEREALLRMQKTEWTTRIVQFSVPVEAVVMEPGAVIMVQHDSNKHTFGGLLGLDAAGTTVTLDRAVTLPSSFFGSGVKLWVRDADDNIFERTITGPFDMETQTLELDAALTAARFDPYAIGRPNEEKWLYRITKLDIEKNETCAITAVEYVESAYYHADYESGTKAI